MRNWERMDGYLTALLKDVYPQPQDSGHSGLAKLVIDQWGALLTTCHSVLDVGCGEGFCQPFFESWGMSYEGVCLGQDFVVARDLGRNVKKMDFNFLEYEDRSFDMVFARHSLEHSPMPILTLMEWHRVARQWLGVVLPAPEWYTYVGANHYSVATMEQAKGWLDRAGWKILWEEIHEESQEVKKDSGGNIVFRSPLMPNEYWLFAEKKR